MPQVHWTFLAQNTKNEECIYLHSWLMALLYNMGTSDYWYHASTAIYVDILI